MGLDVYAGTLTRYYLRDWETVVQQYARENGLQVKIVGPDGEHKRVDDAASRAQTTELVTLWKSMLVDGLKQHLQEPFDWSEDNQQPYFTDKPDWDGYASLVLAAAYSEHPEMNQPRKAARAWKEDIAYKECTAQGAGTRYGNILLPEIWIPIRQDVTFETMLPSSRQAVFGSTYALLDQLQLLNEEVFKGSATDLESWRKAGTGEEGSFEQASRFGLACMIDLAADAVRHNLPMVLDY